MKLFQGLKLRPSHTLDTPELNYMLWSLDCLCVGELETSGSLKWLFSPHPDHKPSERWCSFSIWPADDSISQILLFLFVCVFIPSYFFILCSCYTLDKTWNCLHLIPIEVGLICLITAFMKCSSPINTHLSLTACIYTKTVAWLQKILQG